MLGLPPSVRIYFATELKQLLAVRFALQLHGERKAAVGDEGERMRRIDGDTWVVEGGGRGLASSGSGDVQAGIVAGLLSRGAQPEQAAVWGGHLHGSAGDDSVTGNDPGIP